MLVKSLSIFNFRNFESSQISFNDRLNILIGDNGQGKTNIIEALYLLIEGESFRYSKNENLIRLSENQAMIKAQVLNNQLDYEISLKLTEKRKDFAVNGKAAVQSRINRFSAVLFSPESLNIIKESSDERRQLVDQLIDQTFTGGSALIREYKKVLKTRNRLLKDIAEEKIQLSLGQDTLESLNPAFLRLAAELTCARIQILKDIRPEVENSLNSIHSGKTAEFNFKYIISDQDQSHSEPQKIRDVLQKRLQDLSIPEQKSGVSLVGPHKHDITFLYNGNDSRFYCSQGQQRAIILAYKMAQIVYHQKVHGFYPLLLLDDVLSELDLIKQESLISTLNQTETQTFVTTTDVSLLSKLSMDKASVFKIKNGQVTV